MILRKNSKKELMNIEKEFNNETELDQLYKNLFDMSPDGIISTNLSGTVTSCNPAFLKLSGFTKDEIVGTHITTIPTILKRDIPKSLKVFRFLLAGKATKPIEFRWKRKDGEIRLADVRASLIKKDGKTIGLQAVVRDITEKKMADEAIRINEEKFRNIFENASDCLIYLDLSGKIIDTNSRSVKVFGISRNQLIGMDFEKLAVFSNDDITKIQMFLKKTQTGKESTIDISFTDMKGNLRYLECSGTKIKGVKKIINILVIARDVTERIKAEQKINEQNIKLKELDRTKSDFLNVTSHELRTPITSIKGYTQMLLKQSLGELNDEQDKVLDIIQKNANRLDNLIQDILDFSRLESGTMKFIIKKTDIKEMIEETIDIMQSVADSKDIKLTLDIDRKLPNLTIDTERIKQVFINIINNAIKFSSKKSKIDIIVKKEKNNILFKIQDYGRGIPEDKQKLIFETFYQVDSKNDRKVGGTGLGLSISQGIILSHGGKIWVESKEGKGSAFYFTLPIKSIKDLEKRFKKIDLFLSK